MSQYLIIKKDGVTLGEWSRSTHMYQAFEGAPYGEEKKFNPEQEFQLAIKNIEEKIIEYKDSKDTYEQLLQGSLTYEERYETIVAIKEIEVEIKEYELALHHVYFLQSCWECDRYEENPPKWTWEVR